MTEQGAVPLIVMTKSQDHVEAINSTLRKAGHPVHCTWLPDARDLGDALTQINPEMLVAFIEELGIDLASLMKIKQQSAPGMPVLIMRERVDEAAIADAMRPGRAGCGDAGQPQPAAIGCDPGAPRLPPGTRALDHTVVGSRVSRAAAEFPRRLRRRHHARAGRHHRGCEPRMARAVRLFGRRRAHRHAAHGSVRAGDSSCAQGRPGRLPAGQVGGSRPEGAGAAVGRLELGARAAAHQSRLRERTGHSHLPSRRRTRKTTISKCGSPMRSRTTPRRAFCSSAT